MIFDKLNRISDLHREGGWRGIATKIRHMWKDLWGYRSYGIFVLEFGSNVELWPERLTKLIEQLKKRYEVEWYDTNLLDQIAEYEERRADVTAAQAKTWIDAGHRTVMIRDRGRVVGDCWLAFDSYPFPAPSRKLTRWMNKSGYVYSYMAFVEPRYRGFGVFPLLVAEQVEYARRHGKRGLMGVVLPRSKSSRESVQTMGYHHAGTMRIFRILRKEIAHIELTD